MYLKTLTCLILFVAFPVAAQEAPSRDDDSQSTEFRVATVDIQGLFKNYRKTLVAEREIDLARAEIQKTSQLSTNEIQTRQRAASKKIAALQKGEISDAEAENLKRELPLLRRELQLAEHAKKQERDSANQKLNQQMIRRMAGILEEIVELTAKRAEAEGFDMVIDSSGDNSSQVPPMLFVRNATDITEMMRKELGNPAPAGR